MIDTLISRIKPDSDTNSTHNTTERTILNKEDVIETFDTFAYGLFGDIVQAHESTFEPINKKLQEGRFGYDYDLYLSRMGLLTIVSTIIVLLITTPIFVILGLTGAFTGLLGLPSILDSVVMTILSSIGVGLLTVFSGVVGTYLKISLRASNRKRRIDTTLPYATTYLFALTRGGMNFVEALKVLAESDDAYGEVAREVHSVVRDMEYMSVDLPRAMRRGARRSPSNKFAEFMDDIVAIIESGGDIPAFLESKSEEYIEQAEREQKNFLQTLSLLGEVYVTAFVAGPLFLVIITVVMSMLGGSAVNQLYGIVYMLIPLLSIAFFVLIDTITVDESKLNSTIRTDRVEHDVEYLNETYGDKRDTNERIDEIISEREYKERSRYIREPVAYLIDNPSSSLVITAPIGLLFVLISGFTSLITVSGPGIIQSFIDFPVTTTSQFILAPIFITMLPYTILYEINRRRRTKLLNRLPDALKQLASANAIGISLTESLKKTAESTSGTLGDEFEKVGNDIMWYNNITDALNGFANRIQAPVVARTVKLITKSNEATGDIAEVLDIAAKDVEKRQILKKERSSEMFMYTAVIIISYCVYLFVIWQLDSAFLTEIENIGSTPTPEAAAGGSTGFGTNLDSLPIQQFRMIFYHSTIIQAIGSGLLAGQLGNNDVRAGIKYSLILILLSTTIFFIL